MRKIVESIALILTILTVILIMLYKQLNTDILLTLTVTASTTAYHFDMRILVGYIVDRIMHNKVDYYKKWYHSLPFETKLYKFLRVKEWKDKMPTYNIDTFSFKKHTLEEIVQSMCQSEIVHETIALLSLLPIGLIPIFDADLVFIITSILACIIDMMFVIMQRYNRPRLIKLIEKRKSR